MTVQHRQIASRSEMRRARALRSLLVSTAAVSCLAVGGRANAQAVLPTLPVQVPRSADPTDIAKITSFNPDGNPAHATFGMRIDLQDKSRVIDWATFNVGSASSKAEQVDFTTAGSANLAVLNRVTLPNPSSIFGSITAKSNITVWLVNPSGITFGSTGSFSGGALVLSTAQTTAGFDAKFLNGTQALPLTAPGAGQGGIVLQAGSGLLATAGPILLVAQNIIANAGSTITASAGHVALVAASDVTVPNAFGSPLGIQISKGTTLATASVAANGAINGASVRLYGARQSDVDAALLSVGSTGVLTATKVGGTVVLAAGVADGASMTLTGTATDTDGKAVISHAGTIGFTATDNASAALRSNADIVGGGAIGTLAKEATTVTIAGAGDVTLGNIAVRDDFTLAAAGDLTLGDVASRQGHIALSTTSGSGFIQTGGLAASTSVAVAAAGNATVAGAVTAGTDYTVSGIDVTLGALGTNPTQKAAGLVDIDAISHLRGLGGMILQSNSGGVADAANTRAVRLSGGRSIVFDEATQILGGTARQSVLGVNSFSSITLGTARARQLGEYNTAGAPIFSEGLSVNGAFAAKLLEITGKIDIITAGSMFIGSATSLNGDIILDADGGSIAGFGSGESADLTADDPASALVSAANRKIQVTATDSIKLGTLKAGKGAGGLNVFQIDVQAGTTAAVKSATAADGGLSIVAEGGTAALGAAALKGDLVVEASDGAGTFYDAQVTGKVTAGGNYSVTGANVTLGGDACTVGNCTQAAAGFFSVVANGSITGKSGYSFQSNSGGVADSGAGAGTRYLSLVANGGAISFASDTSLLAGTALQSLLLLNGFTGTPAADATTIALGTVRARRIADATTPAAATFFAPTDFTATDILTAGAFDLDASAGTIRIGKVQTNSGDITLAAGLALRLGEANAVNGNIALSSDTSDITGTALIGTPVTLADYGRAKLTAGAVDAAISVETLGTGTAKLGVVTAGNGTTTRAAAGDQISVIADDVDISSAIGNNGSLGLTALSGDVVLGGGSSARLGAVVDAVGNVRIGDVTSVLGNINVTADNGDVTGLALVPAPAALTDFGRAGLHANGTNATILVQGLNAGSTVKLGAVTAGNGTTASVGAADQVAVTGGTIDVGSAIALNGSLNLTSATGTVALGAGSSSRLDAVVDARTSARIGDLTSVAGNISVIARDGDVTGVALIGAPASLADYGRAGLSATATDATISVAGLTATSTAKLGTVTAGSGTTASAVAGDQIGVSAGTIDVGSGIAKNGSMRLVSSTGAVTLGAGSSARLDAVVDAFTSARIGDLTSLAGNVGVTARGGDITGLALISAPVTLADYGRATLSANGVDKTVTAIALTATSAVKLGVVTAGSGVTASAGAGDQIAISGGALDVASATANNGSVNLTSKTGDVVLGAGSSARLGAVVDAAANARLGGLASLADIVTVTAHSGDISGLALAAGDADETLLTRFGRADLGAAKGMTLTASGGVQLGALTTTTGDLTVNAGSDVTPSDGAIDLTSATATAGSFALTAVSANVAAPVYNGRVTLGAGKAGLDGTITARGAIALGTAATTSTTGRNLTLTAGRFNVAGQINSTAAAVTVRGAVTVGTATTGAYAVTGSKIDLGAGTEQATGTVGITAYGVAAGDGIIGRSALTLVSNSGNAAAANALTLRADGGAGIQFAADSLLLGGGNGVSADIGIHDPLASLTLGTVNARSLQGLDAAHPGFGALAAPNLVDVTGNVILGGAVTTLGALNLQSRTGDITALQAITIGAAGNNDRGLRLTALDATTGGASSGRITLVGAVQTYGDVALDGYGTIRLKAITASPAAGGAIGAIDLTSVAGDVTGLADLLVPLAGFQIGNANAGSGGVKIGDPLAPSPENAIIASIVSAGDISVTGTSLRLGSATSQNGDITIVASGALTGLSHSGAAMTVGNVSADLFAGALAGTVTVNAGGGAGGAHAVNLRTVQAGSDVTINADRIAIQLADSGGTLTLNAGSVLALAAGDARRIVIGGGGDAASAPIAPDLDHNLLDTNYDSARLTALATGGRITVTAGTIAQLGAVQAGVNGNSIGTFDQIHIDAGALTAQSLTAQNGNIFASATRAVAGIGSPLYVGTISAANGVTLTKSLGDIASASDELRVGSIDSGLAGAGALGDVTISSATHARLGAITALNGSVTAKAVAGDLTGLIGASAVGNPPQPAYGLLAINADKAITLGAGRDLQARTLTAGTDIDATAGRAAWIGGDVTAQAGHYRVTGGTVTLGALGGATQQAARDVAIRSTAGAITGGAGLTLVSDNLGSGVDATYLVLDSATDITFADGLGADAISTLRGGAGGTTADIGIRLGAGGTLQLGAVSARTLGTASAPAAGLYTVAPILTTSGAIALRDVQVVRDLAIDNFAGGAAAGLTLDSAVSNTGGIALATAGDLHGAAAPGGFVRTTLTANRGIDTQSGGFTLLGTADAGTGARLVTGGDLDLLTLTTHQGDAVLSAGGDLRANTITATGDGAGGALAVLLANAAVVPTRHLNAAAPGTAGDILAEAGGDITDVARHSALDSIAAFTSTSGGATLTSFATVVGKGLVDVATVQASGTTSGHRDVTMTGRRLALALADASGGSVSLGATESGAAQSDISITAVAVRAASDATLSAGFGTAATPGADNGSIRVGTITTGTGAVSLTALDGDVTGLSGSATGFDTTHDRAVIHAGGAVDAATGGLFQAADVTGTAITIAAGDVAQAGVVANNGAIDVASFTASGPLALTANAASLTGGYDGDIHIGALASGAPDPAAAVTAVGGITTLTTSGVRGDIVVASGLNGTGAVSATSVANMRLSSITTGAGSAITLSALDGDVTGLIGTSTGLDAAHGRAIIAAGGDVGVFVGGLFQAASVRGAAITVEAGDVAQGGVVANNGAIDVGSFTASGPLSLTAKVASLTGGYDGDIRLGALASGAPDPAAAVTTVGGITTLTTSGVRGDIVVASGLNGTGAVTAGSVANMRLSTITSGSAITLSALDGDVTGLVGSSTGLDAAHGRAVVGAGGDVSVVTGGLFQAASVGGGAITVEAGDVSNAGTVANNGAIDVSSFTASGPLTLTARAAGANGYNGDIRIGAVAAGQFDPLASATTVGGATTLTTTGVRGDVVVASALTGTGDVTIASVKNVRLADLAGSRLIQAGGKIAVTASDGAITGLVKVGASGGQIADYGSAGLKTTGTGGITLTADKGVVKLGSVSTSNGDIAITASDVDFSAAINAGGATSTINIIRGALATGTDIGMATQDATHLSISDGELALLAGDTVKIDGLATAVQIGSLGLNAATGTTALEFLGTGTFTLSGTIKDAGAASARTLQIGGAAGALDTAPLGNDPLATAINATLVSGSTNGSAAGAAKTTGGALIDLPGSKLDLRAKRVVFGDAALFAKLDAATAGLDDAGAAQAVADQFVSRPGSQLYLGYGANGDVFLTAKVMNVSYSGFALFQNTGNTAVGAGVVLGDPGALQSVSSPALLLRSLGDSPTNAFGLFGTINGFIGRTASLLVPFVIDIAQTDGGSRVTRITQSNSRINGCVIGSPDKGCLVTDVPPPNLNLFDERQLQLFGVADDLTIPFEPPIGTSNESLIGDFTTTGGVVPDCVPGDPRCPTPGARP